MQDDALKAALLLSVAHMWVTGTELDFLSTRFLPKNIFKIMFWLSLFVTGAVFVCNAVAASKAKDPEKDTKQDTKQGLEIGACVIAAIVFMYTCTLLLTKNIEDKWNKADVEVLFFNSPRDRTMLGVFLYTILTAIAAIV